MNFRDLNFNLCDVETINIFILPPFRAISFGNDCLFVDRPLDVPALRSSAFHFRIFNLNAIQLTPSMLIDQNDYREIGHDTEEWHFFRFGPSGCVCRRRRSHRRRR